MGRLVDGQWVTGSIITSNNKGAYDRKPRTFRDRVSAAHSLYKPEAGRYHMYVSYACPWAHRTLIYRALKELEDIISVSVVHPDMMEYGWQFDDSFPGSTQDHIFGSQYMHQVYQKAQPDVSTSVTVPVLFDKKTNTIVNNESSEIIRIFNEEFNSLTGNQDDYYPQQHRQRIDELNDLIYHNLNNGVYRCGFARSQEAYDEAVAGVFGCLDQIENILSKSKCLVSEKLTEADIRLIPTLLRFDAVYNIHFKCSLKRVSDYPSISRYVKELYAMPAIKKTTFLDHIIRHYYYSHESINPKRIIPQVPTLD